MEDNSNVRMRQFLDFVERADRRLDDLELGKAGKVKTIDISIPLTAWVKNTDAETTAGGYAYCAEISVEEMRATDWASTQLQVASQNAAKQAGMAAFADTMAGAIRYYAAKKPTQALTAAVTVVQGATTG